jgi:DNA-binding SARP family transcriptional activator
MARTSPSKGPQTQLYIECLGRFRLTGGRRTHGHGDWARHCDDRAGVYKVQSVLAYLVHSGRRGTTRSALNQMVWSRKASSATVSRTLGAMSAVLSDLCGAEFTERHLLIAGDHLSLAPEAYLTDADCFGELYELATQVEQSDGLIAAAPHYEEALKRYGGPYMIDIPRSAYWCGERREQLTGAFVNSCERLAEHTFNERRYRSCISVCQQGLDVEETADDLVCWLLRSFAALGHSAELEHTYRLYLRAVSGGDERPSDSADLVTRTYRSLQHERSVGDR